MGGPTEIADNDLADLLVDVGDAIRAAAEATFADIEIGPARRTAHTGEEYQTIIGKGTTVTEAFRAWRALFAEYATGRVGRLIWRIAPHVERLGADTWGVRARLIVTSLPNDEADKAAWEAELSRAA